MMSSLPAQASHENSSLMFSLSSLILVCGWDEGYDPSAHNHCGIEALLLYTRLIKNH